MRSLWRKLALRWLGGRGSEALTGDSALFDMLTRGQHLRTDLAVCIRRETGVFHHAMMPPHDPSWPDRETAGEPSGAGVHE
jgi:hypothetical protein